MQGQNVGSYKTYRHDCLVSINTLILLNKILCNIMLATTYQHSVPEIPPPACQKTFKPHSRRCTTWRIGRFIFKSESLSACSTVCVCVLTCFCSLDIFTFGLCIFELVCYADLTLPGYRLLSLFFTTTYPAFCFGPSALINMLHMDPTTTVSFLSLFLINKKHRILGNNNFLNELMDFAPQMHTKSKNRAHKYILC